MSKRKVKYSYNSALAIEQESKNKDVLESLEKTFDKMCKDSKSSLKEFIESLLSTLEDDEDLSSDNVNNHINQSCFEDMLQDFIQAEYDSIQEKILSNLSYDLECNTNDLDDKLESLEHTKELTNKLKYMLPELDNYYSNKGEYFTYKELQDLTDECIKTVDEIL